MKNENLTFGKISKYYEGRHGQRSRWEWEINGKAIPFSTTELMFGAVNFTIKLLEHTNLIVEDYTPEEWRVLIKPYLEQGINEYYIGAPKKGS